VGTTVYGDGEDAETPTRKTATKTVDDHGESRRFDHRPRRWAAGTVGGTSYSQTAGAAGGITPYAWAVTERQPAGGTDH